MRRVQRRKKPLDYLLPFLILISLGVIIVLGFQLIMNWGKQGEGDVYFYIAEGKAKVLPYGNTDWDNAYSGTKLLLGDSLKTSFGSRAVLEFFNDTIIRMGEDTAVSLNDVTKTSDNETIVLNMDNGMVWVNGQKSAGVREAVYEVRTKNMKVVATGTVFEVESDVVQVVRVFDGEVKVDVVVDSQGTERVVDTIPVGVGQEVYLDDAAINAFADNKSPSVLNAVDDEFKDTAWYKWNILEDSSPTDYSVSSKAEYDEFISDDEDVDDELMDDESDEEDTDDEADDDSSDDDEEDLQNNLVKAPEITGPSDTTTTTGKLTISGTVGSNVTEIIVESEVDGNLDKYSLSQFKQGDSSWSYNVSESFNNIAPGENVYKVYAYDEDGNESAPAKITITYDKDKVEVEGDLSDPRVLSYNGSESSVVTDNTVTVTGEISGAEKVVVNGYTLSKFTPGGTSWTYIASEALGNMSPGENTYEVYGVDPDGNKSSVVKFTITYNKSGEETAEEDTTAETGDDEAGPTEETVTEEETSDVPYGF